MSDARGETAADEAADRRTAPLRVLGAATLVLVVATLVARLAMGAFERQARGLPDDVGSGPKRLAKFVEHLPAISERPDDAGFVLGSSIAYFGVALDTFDGRMAQLGVPLTSYTAATPMLTPGLQLVIARQIERAFANKGHQVELMLLELTPQGMTTASATVGGPFRRAALTDLAAVADAQSIVELAVEQPADAAHVVSLAALGNEDPQNIDGLLGHYLLETAAERARVPPTTILWRSLVRKFGDDAGAWNPRTRGEPRWLWPESQFPYMVAIRGALESKRHKHDERVRRLVEWNDAIDLHFDPRRLRDFIALVKKSQSFAVHTVVWMAPRNTEFVELSPEGLDRLAEVLETLTRETHVPIVDLSSVPGIGPDDFLDTQHLTEHGGRPKLSVALAEGVARAIKKEEAGGPD